MILLAVQRIKGSFYALSPELQQDVMAGSVAFAESFSKSGENKVNWVFSDSMTNPCSPDADLPAECVRICFGYPLNPYIEIDLIPVADYEAAAEIAMRVLSDAHEQ